MGQFIDKWEDGLRPNFAQLAGDLRRHQAMLAAGDPATLDSAHETFRDILKIATTHVYRIGGDLAKAAELSQSKLSGLLNGHRKISVEEQIDAIDIIIEELEHRSAAAPSSETTQPQTLSETFTAARSAHLQTLNHGIDDILGRAQEVSDKDFHMVLTTAQGVLYSDQATKKLADKFNTSSPTYISWIKGDSAPRTDDARRKILTTIGVDAALTIAGA